MTESFLTYGNDYLLLSPFHIGILNILTTLFILILLIYNSLVDKKTSVAEQEQIFKISFLQKLKDLVSKLTLKTNMKSLVSKKTNLFTTKYILLSCLIAVNSLYIPFFIKNLTLEANKYIGLDYQSSINNIEQEEFNDFLLYLNNKLPINAKISINDPNDPFFLNVKYKFKLAYYLLPRIITYTPSIDDYLIIVDCKNPKKINIEVSSSLEPILLYSSENFKLIKFKKRKALNSYSPGRT